MDLHTKLLRDPFYAAAWSRYGDHAAMATAKFFDDGLSPQQFPAHDPGWLTTPVHKIARNDRARSATGRRAVLVVTGAFSPPHEGHLEMLHLARVALEERGVAVLGGYLSPSHDDYVSTKDGGAAALHAERRIALCEAAVAGSDWIAVDPWEARYVPTALNYTDVVLHLENMLAPIEVHYVFGGDNAGFARAFVGRGFAVLVPRVGWEHAVASVLADPVVAASGRLVLAGRPARAVSSRGLRGRSRAAPERPTDPVLYAVRDDLLWATEPWAVAPPIAARFRERVIAALTCAFAQVSAPDRPVRVQVAVADHAAQQHLVEVLRRQRPVLSLDPATDGDANLAVSRLYALSDGQLRHEGLVPRPGSRPIAEQLAALPPGTYTLLDDDSVTGDTMRQILGLLPPGVQVTATATLLGEMARPPHDVADLRDFLLGARHAGLVVELLDGSVARAPYLLPYVGPARLGTPPTSAVALSRALWAANAEFFAERPDLTVAAADPAVAALLSAAGFTPHTPLVDVSTWHLAKLTRWSAVDRRPDAALD